MSKYKREITSNKVNKHIEDLIKLRYQNSNSRYRITDSSSTRKSYQFEKPGQENKELFIYVRNSQSKIFTQILTHFLSSERAENLYTCFGSEKNTTLYN